MDSYEFALILTPSFTLATAMARLRCVGSSMHEQSLHRANLVTPVSRDVTQGLVETLGTLCTMRASEFEGSGEGLLAE